MNESVNSRYCSFLEEVEAYAGSCGRDPKDIRVVAVSKTTDAESINQTFLAGARDFGENRPARIAEMQTLFPEARWHFIGNIQSRCIPEIVAHASLIHSVDSLEHLKKINIQAQNMGKIQPVLVEVNVSGEATKGGILPADVFEFVREGCEMTHISMAGLMTMAPQGDLGVAFETFRDLKILRDRTRSSLSAEKATAFRELSMGMSEDWKEAIRAGSTIIRPGRVIFSHSFGMI